MSHIFKIGAVVALKPHPFFEDQNNILVSGDPDSIPPLMVIIETVREARDSFDESTGMQLTQKDSYKCNCLWFSTKSNKFESDWISSSLLKIIEQHSGTLPIEEFKESGKLVAFKTVFKELSKRKISLKQNSNYPDAYSNTITAHLSFVCPVMQIIGAAKSESKEPLYDLKTKGKKREIPELLIKCKFYNHSSDKLSEFLLPIEALDIIEEIDPEILVVIQNCILEGKLLSIPFKSSRFDTTLFKPSRLIYRQGYYIIEGINILDNNVLEHILTSEDDFSKLFSPEIALPIFHVDEVSKSLMRKGINKTELDLLDKKKVWLILYKDINEQITTRAIFDRRFFELNEEHDGKPKAVNYIGATCLLRNAERFFRVDRIQNIKVLDIAPKPIKKK